MEDTHHAFNIAIAVYMVIGTLAIIKFIIDIIAGWREDKNVYKSTMPDRHGVTFEDEMYHHGYMFCTCFKVSDIHMVARKMGVVITKQEAIMVASEIKKDFTIAVGIDEHRIKTYIRIFIKHNH